MADHDALHCPACGRKLELEEAAEKAGEDPHARLTCPTCGAGLDREGNLVHEPAVGP